MEICIHVKTYIRMFISASFVIVKTGNTSDVLPGWKVKQTEAHPYQGIVLSNKEQPSIDTQSNVGESPENYAELKKNAQRCYTAWFCYYNILLNDKITEIENTLTVTRG